MSGQFAAVVKGLAFPVPVKLFGLTPFGKAMRAREKLSARLMREVERCRAEVAASSGGGGGGEGEKAPMLRRLVEARGEDGKNLTDKACFPSADSSSSPPQPNLPSSA